MLSRNEDSPVKSGQYGCNNTNVLQGPVSVLRSPGQMLYY